MKKLFSLLFTFIISLPCFAITITKSVGPSDVFSMASNEMKIYYQHKDCKAAMQVIKNSNENYFLFGFINGVYASTDCLDKEPIKGSMEMALYMTQGNSSSAKGQGMNYILEHPENPKTIGFYNKVEGLSFLVGYYYATHDARVLDVMKQIVEKTKTEHCLKISDHEQGNSQCPHKEVVNFATEFLKRYDTMN